MSLELALNAIQNRAAYVATEDGSPHGHAAIQLMSQDETLWLRGLSETDARRVAASGHVDSRSIGAWNDPDLKRPAHRRNGGAIATYFNPSRKYTRQRPASDLLAMHLGSGLSSMLGRPVCGRIDESDRMFFESDSPIDDLVRQAAFDPNNIERAADRLADLGPAYEFLTVVERPTTGRLDGALADILEASVAWHWHYSELYTSMMAQAGLGPKEQTRFLLGFGNSAVLKWARAGGLPGESKMVQDVIELPRVAPMDDWFALSRAGWWEASDWNSSHLAALILLKEWSLALTLAVLSRLSIDDLHGLLKEKGPQ